MKKLPMIARILLGLPFLVFGLNGLIHFMPMPPMEGDPATFISALLLAGYLMPLVALVQAVSGALLLSGRFVPLALTLLAPILINIIGFHAVLAPAPKDFVMPIVLLVLEIYLAWAYRAAFKPMLEAKVTPSA